jgi:transcriptional regulator with XRE-family HTH domain
MSKMKITRGSGPRKRDDVLTAAKLALVEAHERGDRDALMRALREHPIHADALTEFELSLLATSSYTDEEANAPDVLEVAELAREQAFAAVFGAPVSKVVAARSLKDLRAARKLSLSALAATLGLGLDVLSALESGRIRIASVPRRLSEALGEALDSTAEQISAALALNAAPALRRGQPGASAAANKQVDFADAVMVSQSMTPEQRARWLAESVDS